MNKIDSKINIIIADADSDQNLINLLKEYQSTIHTCIGPINSSFKLISRSNDYNDLMLTSTSKNLFSIFYDSNTENLKQKWQFDLIKTIIKESHLDHYYDSGLFLTHLINEILIQNHIYELNKSLVDSILKNLIEHLLSTESPIRIKLDLNNIHFLKKLISTCLLSKPILDKQDQFVNLYLKAFINSFQGDNQKNFAQILYLINDNFSSNLNDSLLTNGVLFPIDNSQIYSKFLSNKTYKCVLFDSSFSGDFEQINSQEFQIEVNSKELHNTKTSRLILDKFIRLCDFLITKFEINFILCQKVLHPSLKNYLIKRNVLYIDRLSLMYMKSISELTSCKIVSNSFNSTQFDSTHFGYLKSIKIKKILNKEYIHLENDQSLVQTLTVCIQNEHLNSELDCLLRVTENVLKRTFVCGYALCGGACFYSYCICYTWKYLSSNFTKNKLFTLMRIFKLVFYNYGKNLLDNKDSFRLELTNGHQFKINSNICQCGLYSIGNKQNLIDLNEDMNYNTIDIENLLCDLNSNRNESNVKLIDSLDSKLNAFSLAREILSAILHIGVYIY